MRLPSSGGVADVGHSTTLPSQEGACAAILGWAGLDWIAWEVPIWWHQSRRKEQGKKIFRYSNRIVKLSLNHEER